MQTNFLAIVKVTSLAAAIFFAGVAGCDRGTPVVQQTTKIAAGDMGPSNSKPGEEVASSESETEAGSAHNETDGSQTPPQPAAADSSVEVISFDDLNIGMPVDARFRPQMLDYNDGRVKELLGKKVNVAGYMNPTDTLKGVTEFILLRNLECKFGPGGQADHLVHVLMDKGMTTEFTDKVVYVEGVMTLNPFPLDEPITWSIYDVKATKVSTKAPPRSR